MRLARSAFRDAGGVIPMREFSLAEFAVFVAEELGEGVEHARESALELGAKAIQHEAKRVLGTYLFDWEQLAPATQADREHQGYPANEPLLRSGEMRDSIHYTIIKPGVEAEIGSDSDIALWQELGTETGIPPRPFLSASAAYLEKPIVHMIKETVGAAVAGQTIQGEILKIAIETFQDLAHDANELLEGDDDQRHGKFFPLHVAQYRRDERRPLP